LHFSQMLLIRSNKYIKIPLEIHQQISSTVDRTLTF
jgi:hypothetical protein